jgi:hypothetical protein
MRSSDFFIIGAPKCGTTALFQYLGRHPDIFVPRFLKEPHYFAEDLHAVLSYNPLPWVTKEEEYVSLFETAGPTQAIGEASVFYLHSKKAAEAIFRRKPGAKLIAMFRHPVDALSSMFQEYRYRGIENNPTFASAWRSESAGTVPIDRRQPVSYSELALWGSQLNRFLEIFPASQVRTIFFDDFCHDTAAAYSGTLEFLGIDSSFKTDLSPINVSRMPRSRRLQQLVFSWRPRGLIDIVRAISPKSWRHFLAGWLTRLNSRAVQRDPVPIEVQLEILEHLREEIDLLEKLTGRNLDGWRSPLEKGTGGSPTP